MLDESCSDPQQGIGWHFSPVLSGSGWHLLAESGCWVQAREHIQWNQVPQAAFWRGECLMRECEWAYYKWWVVEGFSECSEASTSMRPQHSANIIHSPLSRISEPKLAVLSRHDSSGSSRPYLSERLTSRQQVGEEHPSLLAFTVYPSSTAWIGKGREGQTGRRHVRWGHVV